MDIKLTEGRAYVTLSKRNCLQLLEALDRGFGSGLKRLCEDGTTLYVICEDDADHYKERKAGPGLDRVLEKPTRLLTPIKE